MTKEEINSEIERLRGCIDMINLGTDFRTHEQTEAVWRMMAKIEELRKELESDKG